MDLDHILHQGKVALDPLLIFDKLNSLLISFPAEHSLYFSDNPHDHEVLVCLDLLGQFSAHTSELAASHNALDQFTCFLEFRAIFFRLKELLVLVTQNIVLFFPFDGRLYKFAIFAYFGLLLYFSVLFLLLGHVLLFIFG